MNSQADLNLSRVHMSEGRLSDDSAHIYPVILANSVNPDQTPQNAASDQGTLFAIYTAISIKHGNDKNQSTSFLMEMDRSKESVWHKWVKCLHVLCNSQLY